MKSSLRAAAFAAVALVAFPQQLTAIPAMPWPVLMTQPDGTQIEVLLRGDERAHAMLTPDGLSLLEIDGDGWLRKVGSRHAAAGSQKSPRPMRRLAGRPSFPAFGQQRSLAILVEFQDKKFASADPRQEFDDMLNKLGTGSVHDYYYDSSAGQFDLTFDTFGPVTLSRNAAYYATKTDGQDLQAWEMAVEACEALDGELDFSQYDLNRDGQIDNVYIFYAGAGAATGGDPGTCIWQHAADIEVVSGRKVMLDGVQLNHYACSNEWRDVRVGTSTERRMEGIGTVCHEFGHVLGWPDIYDIKGICLTPGTWTLMDTGCHNNDSRTPPLASAYERMFMGWLEPTAIGTEPQSLSLEDITHNHAFMIQSANPDEYFLLENRQQEGWDAYLPGHGMLVWHICYSKANWEANEVNTINGRLGIDLVRADGINSSSTLEGDPFPGTRAVTSLTDDGFPNLLTVDGKRTNAPLSNITEAGGVISFDVCKAVTELPKVDGLAVSDLTPWGFNASWNSAHARAGYLLNVFNANNEHVGEYSDLSVSTTSAQIEGLEPDTDYWFTVRAVSGSIQGEESDAFAVHTPAMGFAFTAPVALEAEAVTADGFTARWEPLEGAESYRISVYTREPGDDRVASADFAGGINEIPAGWSTNCSFTMSIAGYYGESAPSLSMTDDYCRLQSPAFDTPLRALEFWYRERSGSGSSSLEVQTLQDGHWQTVDEIALPAKMSEGLTYSCDLTDGRAVRLIYHRVDKGSLAIDDVRVTFAGEDADQLVKTSDSAQVDGLDPATQYYYRVQGLDADGTLSLASEAIPVLTLENSGISEISVESEGQFYDLLGRKVLKPSRGIYIKNHRKFVGSRHAAAFPQNVR